MASIPSSMYFIFNSLFFCFFLTELFIGIYILIKGLSSESVVKEQWQ